MVTARVRVKSQTYLSRLAVVYADPLRLKIVTELYLREMSPTQFRKEFGGSRSSIDRHFKTLIEYRWLRRVWTDHGGRPGAPEYFYRATEPAIFDLDTWSQLPYPVRAAFSWRTFEQLAEHVGGALEAGTFDARPDRHLSWTPLVLDRRGWKRTIAALDALFETLFDEQADAKLRLARSDEEPIPATVSLIGFESPMPQRNPDHRLRGSDFMPSVLSPAIRLDSKVPFTMRLAKVFADPLNLKIITELSIRQMSATQLTQELGGASFSDFFRRTKMLADMGWLVKVDEKTGGRRRGSTEIFYQATGPAIFDGDSWSEVPNSVKTTLSWRTFSQLSEKVTEAVDSGTFDARPERHFSWSPFLLDQLAWKQIISAVDDLFRSLFREQTNAKVRIEKSGEDPLLATIALLAFESPSGASSVFERL